MYDYVFLIIKFTVYLAIQYSSTIRRRFNRPVVRLEGISAAVGTNDDGLSWQVAYFIGLALFIDNHDKETNMLVVSLSFSTILTNLHI